MSADGSTIVGYTRIGSEDIAFIGDDALGMRSVRDLLTDELGLDLTGWTLQSANAISADGLTITGNGFNPSGDAEAWIARIPEPATLSILALGGMAVMRRRR